MSLTRFLFNLVFPPRCLGCMTTLPHDITLCDACEKKIVFHQTLFCGSCGLRLPAAVSTKAGLATYKRTCHKDFPYVLGAATDFGNDIVRNLIHALKFHCARGVAETLGTFLVRYAEALSLPLKNFLVVPIPLSRARMRERGFNQSELIAKVFADHFNLPLERGMLTRIKNMKPQSETKGLLERKENIAGVFVVRDPDLVAKKNIILIDDVTTSGSTLLEAASTLKNAGAKKIIALAVARA